MCQLHASGELSDEEFEKARTAMIESVNPLKSENDADNGNAKPGNDENSQQNVKWTLADPPNCVRLSLTVVGFQAVSLDDRGPTR